MNFERSNNSGIKILSHFQAFLPQKNPEGCIHIFPPAESCVSLIMQMQRELNSRRGEGSDIKDGSSAHRGVFSLQESPCNVPRPPHAPQSPCSSGPVPSPPKRSHSDSEALLGERGSAMRLKGPTENLFLDALSLDPLSGLEVPPPCRLESDKRFPCINEVM